MKRLKRSLRRQAFEDLKESLEFILWRKTQRKLQYDRCFYFPLKKSTPWAMNCKRQLLGHAYHVDHVYPLHFGGSNNVSNLVLACEDCNKGKGTDILTPMQIAACGLAYPNVRIGVKASKKKQKTKPRTVVKKVANWLPRSGAVDWDAVFKR